MNQPVDRPVFRDIADRIAAAVHVRDHLNEWDIQAISKADAFREFDEKIMAYLQNQLINHVGQFDSYLEIIAKRRLSHWYDEYQWAYEAIEQAVKLFKLHANTIILSPRPLLMRCFDLIRTIIIGLTPLIVNSTRPMISGRKMTG
ncbi:hypothetical protein QS257_06520 [Terrilactibacillus sp. S3-3]|nr:hypothetical protein QS257_06520 [Terrilactibacillus sp. S3-3]